MCPMSRIDPVSLNMKNKVNQIRSYAVFRRLCRWLLFSFVMGTAGCTSIAENVMVMKYPVQPESIKNISSPNHYQEAPFFSMVTYTESAFYVAPDRPVFNGMVIVLANQNTKSAAAWVAALLQDNRLAVVLGTTIDYHPTGPTGFTPFKLPHTGLRISLPSDYFERAVPAKGEDFQPDYWVEDTVEDVYAGRDAAFEKALELIRTP